MINWGLDPVFLRLGSLEIRYYGIVFVIGFIISLIVLSRAVKKRRLEASKEQIYDLIFYILLGVIIGARVFHVIFWGFDYYFANPLKILYLWQGGLSFHGGLVGATTATYIFSRRNNINFWRIADVLTLPALFVLALGRIANFINQEILGTITELPWCVKFLRTDPLNCRHPIQLYAAIGRFSAFFFLLKFDKEHKDGYIFWNFVFLVGIGRLLLDFLREDLTYLGLRSGQWLSILMILVGGYFLFTRYFEDVKYSLGFSNKITSENK